MIGSANPKSKLPPRVLLVLRASEGVPRWWMNNATKGSRCIYEHAFDPMLKLILIQLLALPVDQEGHFSLFR